MTDVRTIDQFDIMDETHRVILADLLEDMGREDEAAALRAGPVFRREDGRFIERYSGSLTMGFGPEWREAGLGDVSLECAEFVNQSEYGDAELEGEFFIADDYNAVIVCGSFGNYNSPGCTGCTHAEFYDSREEYRAALEKWESMPEQLESDDDESEDDEDEYDSNED